MPSSAIYYLRFVKKMLLNLYKNKKLKEESVEMDTKILKERKSRTQKGITLVALIITIIVLLILAVVAIRAVQGDGIIAHAKNARNEYEEGQKKEKDMLSYYESYLGGTIGKWVQEGTTFKKINEDGTIMEIKIGDKVNYNEGYSVDKPNTVDTNFKMDDMEWRILDVEEDGTVKLISTKPTTSTLTLSGEQGWLDAETKLDTLCSNLYAHGTGITARSLKVEDIDKLANMLTPEARKAESRDYGRKFKYKYDTTANEIRYSKQNDDGTWTAYARTWNAKFKDPRNAEINSTHYQDAEGNPIIAELEYTDYYYRISNKIPSTVKTADNILVSDLISNGLNSTNDAANSSNVTQWLSSRCVNCDAAAAYFKVRLVLSGGVSYASLWYSKGTSSSKSSAVRPVINLPSNVLTTKVDGTWQVNI